MRYIIANWKMNLNLADITSWLEKYQTAAPSQDSQKTVVIAASTPYLGLLSELDNQKRLKLAAQDVSLMEKGAHTGEVGAFQLKDFCSYCIIGHSERKESLAVAVKKRDACLANGITPIFCFVNIEDASKIYVPNILLVWEDPSNISVGGVYKAKPVEEIQAGVDEIRKILPKEAALIYGGSVNRQNIEALAVVKGLDGVLPGNASNDPIHFAELVTKF